MNLPEWILKYSKSGSRSYNLFVTVLDRKTKKGCLKTDLETEILQRKNPEISQI